MRHSRSPGEVNPPRGSVWASVALFAAAVILAWQADPPADGLTLLALVLAVLGGLNLVLPLPSDGDGGHDGEQGGSTGEG